MTKLRQAFPWNRGYKEYFAVKTAPNPFLLNILKDMGCSADYSSMTELMASGACGLTGHDIIFSSNDTPPEELTCAQKMGAIVNLDDIIHIEYLEQILGYIPETISCRYNPSGVFRMGNGTMDNPGGSKHGMTRNRVFQAFKTLKTEGAKYFGIRAFLVSSTVTNEYCPMLAEILLEPAVDLREETGTHISLMNLSGDIDIPYHPDQEPNDILAISSGVRKVYEEVLVQVGTDDVAVYTELGRFTMGSYGALAVKTIHERHTHKEYVGMDVCAVNLMRPVMYDAYHHITIMGKEEAPCDYMYGVVGFLCESNDRFAVDHSLPEIEKGDLPFIHDAGVYRFTMEYNYNGKSKSAELLLEEDGSAEMIRRAETPEDYFATFDFCDILKCVD